MTKHDEAYHSILEEKYARIIAAIAEMHGLSFEKSMDILYHSPLLPLIEDGVADLHCRSDRYLAEEIASTRASTGGNHQRFTKRKSISN